MEQWVLKDISIGDMQPILEKIVMTYYLFQGVTADENSANGHKKSGLQFFLNTQKGVKLNPKSWSGDKFRGE